MMSKKFAPLFLLITLAGVAVRLYDLGRRSLWSDELEHLFAAQVPLGEMWERLKIQLTPPLDYIVTHAFLKLESVWPFSFESLVRLPACLASIAALLLIYREVSNLFLLSVISLSVFLINYAQECRPYSLVFLLSYVSFYFWQRKQWKNWTLINCIGVMTHYFFPLLLAAQLAQALTNRKQTPWRPILRGFALAFTAWLLITPLFLEQFKQVAGNASYQYGQTSGIGFVPSILSQFIWPFSKTQMGGWLFFALAVLGAIRIRKKNPALLYWAGIPFALAWGISQFAAIATAKNMIIVLYPALALATEGLSFRSVRWGGAFACIGIFLFSIFYYEQKVEKEDYRGVAQFISKKIPSGIILMEQEYGFGPVYLSRVKIDPVRFVDFWVPDRNQEPKRSRFLKIISEHPPSVFVSRQLDRELEAEIVKASRLESRQEFAGLTVYWRP